MSMFTDVSNALLTRFGARQPGSAAQPEVPAPKQTRNLFGMWGRYTSAYGMPPKKSHLELIESYRSWVYGCVRVLSNRVGMLPIELIQVETQSDETVQRKQIESHPFLDTLWSPNPFTTRMELWLTTINHLELCGNAYWLILKDRLGIPRQIWPLYPQYMRVIPDPVNFIKGYVYLIDSPPIKFEMDNPEYNIVHFSYPNPINPYYGMGPLEAQAYAYDLDLYTEVYQRNFFQEGARPDFVLETDQKIQRGDAELIWELWDERHKGMLKSWRPGILGHGLKARALNVSNRDMAFAVLADWSRDKMLAAFGVPAAKLGLVVDVNRANADAADLTFNREAVKPRVTLLGERIEKDIIALYPGQDDTVWFEAGFEDPVPEDRELKLKERETNLKNGVTIINEEREDDGRDPVAWGDVPLLPANIAPLGTALPASPGKETPPPTGTTGAPAPLAGGTPPSLPAPLKALPPAVADDAGQRSLESDEENLSDDDVYALRTRYWETFAEARAKSEQALVPQVNSVFRKEEAAVIAALKDNYVKLEAYFTGWSPKKILAHLQRAPGMIDTILFSMDDLTDAWRITLEEAIQREVDINGKAKVGEIGVGQWDVLDPAVVEWIQSSAGNAIKEIQDTTRTALRTTLIDGVQAGESEAQLSKRVATVYNQATDYRSQRIARTEIHTAANYGALQGYKQTGVVGTKEWITARDERVRETHLDVDRVAIPLNDDFQVGAGRGPCPGQIGRSEEDINCRCTIIGRVVGADGKKQKAPVSSPDDMRTFLQAKVEELKTTFGSVEGGVLSSKIMDALDKSIKKATVATVMDKITIPEKTKAYTSAQEMLVSRLRILIDAQVLGRVRRPVELNYLERSGRAFYRARVGHFAGEISAVKKTVHSSRSTLLHEFGHHLEHGTSGLRKMSKLFREYRTEGERRVSLKKLFPASGYKQSEMTKKDKFYHAYVGKDYDDGCTEVVSMGLERFDDADLAASFWRKDPEHFAYIWSILTGAKFEITATRSIDDVAVQRADTPSSVPAALEVREDPERTLLLTALKNLTTPQPAVQPVIHIHMPTPGAVQKTVTERDERGQVKTVIEKPIPDTSEGAAQ